MKATIDSAGRIVVPKAIRDAMGLEPGSRLDVTYTDGRIEIDFAPTEFTIEKRDGVSVVRAVGDVPAMDDDIVRQVRDEIYDERVRRHV